MTTEQPHGGRWSELFSLHGKVALVTGAAGGFGSAVARGFAQAGADLVLTDKNAEGLRQLADEFAPLNRRVFTRELDVMDEAEIERVVSEAVSHMGRLDVLVHIGGEARLAPIAEMTTEDFDFSISSHLRGTFLVARAVGNRMRKTGGGSVVLMSSIASFCALGRGTGAYAAAKAGVNALVRELAVEWAPDGIRVNAVAPCQFRTIGLRKMLQDPKYGQPGELERKMVSAIPIGRLGEPEEMLGPCLFLASEAASMVTGQVILVDGGYTIR